MTKRALSVLLIAGFGCGTVDPGTPASGTEGESSSGGATTAPEIPTGSGGTSGTTVDPGQTVTGGSDTTDGGTDATDATDGGNTTDGGSVSVCDPQPMDLGPFALNLDWDPKDPVLDQTVDLDVMCTVTSIASPGGEHSIELDCEDAPHVLDVSDLGPIDLAADDVVRLRAFDTQPWWLETYILLQREDQVIVAGTRTSSLPAGAGNMDHPPGTFFDPLGVAVVPDVCRPEPPAAEDPEPCNFLCGNPCFQLERQALEITLGGQSVVVYDGNLGTLDGLQVAVSAANLRLNVQCSDTPGSWYQLVVMRTL